MNILEHPTLEDLKAVTQRERLLVYKAFIEGFEAALRSVEHFGLAQARVIHEHSLQETQQRLDELSKNDE